MNYSISINLSRLAGAVFTNLKGKTATKRCLVIPIDDACLYAGEKGIYMSLVAYEQREAKYGNTHLVKRSLSKAEREAMTDEQLRAMPILGDMKEMKPAAMQPTMEMQGAQFVNDEGTVDDLPF